MPKLIQITTLYVPTQAFASCKAMKPKKIASGPIYTLGTSKRTLAEFLAILKASSISTVVDVRRFPTSHLEHFRQENLKKALEDAGIGYCYAGHELGGYRRGGYEEYTKKEAFRAGIERIENLARRGSVAIVCAERFPWRCHRRFIAAQLTRCGWQVVHIIDPDRFWTPKA